MGANQSHHIQCAQQAYEAAKFHHRDLGGPRPTNAIFNYLQGKKDSQTVIETATPLEVNEFKKVNPEHYAPWYLDHVHMFRCKAETCTGEMNHLEGCPRDIQPIPADIRANRNIMNKEADLAKRLGYGPPGGWRQIPSPPTNSDLETAKRRGYARPRDGWRQSTPVPTSGNLEVKRDRGRSRSTSSRGRSCPPRGPEFGFYVDAPAVCLMPVQPIIYAYPAVAYPAVCVHPR